MKNYLLLAVSLGLLAISFQQFVSAQEDLAQAKQLPRCQYQYECR